MNQKVLCRLVPWGSGRGWRSSLLIPCLSVSSALLLSVSLSTQDSFVSARKETHLLFTSFDASLLSPVSLIPSHFLLSPFIFLSPSCMPGFPGWHKREVRPWPLLSRSSWNEDVGIQERCHGIEQWPGKGSFVEELGLELSGCLSISDSERLKKMILSKYPIHNFKWRWNTWPDAVRATYKHWDLVKRSSFFKIPLIIRQLFLISWAKISLST